MCWSPNSQFLLIGSIDSKTEILRLKDRNSLSLKGHTSYVQGVTWDPINQMIATQSADRSCRISMVRILMMLLCFLIISVVILMCVVEIS